jgi:hypothetical protein
MLLAAFGFCAISRLWCFLARLISISISFISASMLASWGTTLETIVIALACAKRKEGGTRMPNMLSGFLRERIPASCFSSVSAAVLVVNKGREGSPSDGVS